MLNLFLNARFTPAISSERFVLMSALGLASRAAIAPGLHTGNNKNILRRTRGVRMSTRKSSRGAALSVSAEVTTTPEGITVNTAPSDEEIVKCKKWGTWGCEASTFPWTYGSSETCYLLEGEVTVTPDGGGQPVSIKAGDIATFPAGMSCTWDVHVAVNKHFNFH